MSDLTGFRDHCRKMAGASQVAVAEASLWLQMAEEIDAYLAAPTAEVDLFGEVTAEPTPDAHPASQESEQAAAGAVS